MGFQAPGFVYSDFSPKRLYFYVLEATCFTCHMQAYQAHNSAPALSAEEVATSIIGV